MQTLSKSPEFRMYFGTEMLMYVWIHVFLTAVHLYFTHLIVNGTEMYYTNLPISSSGFYTN